MEATYFITRGGYVNHRFSSLRPSVTSFSLFKRRHSNVSLRSSTCTNFYRIIDDPEIIFKQYMMSRLKLVTLSPMNTEYPEEVKELLPIFSKYGFFLYRLIVQVKWLLKLSDIPEVKEVPKFSVDARTFLERIILELRESNMDVMEYTEHIVIPDVRAVLNFLKEKCKGQSEISKVLQNYQVTCTPEMFLTAYEMMVKDAIHGVMLPLMTDLCKTLFALMENPDVMTKECKALITLIEDEDEALSSKPSMVKRLDKYRKQELAFHADQLSKVAKCMRELPVWADFTGEKRHYIANKYHDEIDWSHVAEEFVTSLGLKFGPDIQIRMQGNTELFCSMLDFNKILDQLNPIVIKGRTIESELSLSKIFEAANMRFLRIFANFTTPQFPPPDYRGGLTLVPFTNPFPHDMALFMGYSLVRCKGILQELKKLQ